MRMKTYQANSIQEALLSVKEEMGPEAVILKTQKVKSSVLGKEMFEVTAALEERLFATPVGEKSSSFGAKRNPRPLEESPETRKVELYNFKKVKENGLPADTDEKPNKVGKRFPDREKFSDEPMYREPEFKREPRRLPEQVSLEEALERLRIPLENIQRVQGGISELIHKVGSLQNSIDHLDLDSIDKDCSHWFQALVDLGVESELSRELVRRAQYMIPPNKRSDDSAFFKVMSKLIKNRLVCGETWEFKPGRPFVVVVGGLPGSGKSHLVNSLALYYKVKQKKEVGILNLDHFRLGADQALASFSRVTEIQTTTTYSLKEAEDWLHRWSDQDLILIDTPGTAPADHELWMELKSLIGNIQPDRCIWVADSTMRHRDLVENCRKFKTIGFNELAFSKLDIAQAKGCVYNLSQVCKMPIGPISTSRDVMENTHFPNPHDCLEWILPQLQSNPVE